jgi:hypothetical protein
MSTLRDLADHIRKEKEKAPKAAEDTVTGVALVMVDALDNALVMIGRSGTEIFHSTMKQVYGFDKADIALRPGEYMSALKALFDASSDMIEGYILREVRRTKNITAGSIEDAVNMLVEQEQASIGDRSSAFQAFN